MTLLKLDLRQIARLRRRRCRHAGGGMDYLHRRIKLELAERWALSQPEDGGGGAQVLQLDFDRAELSLGDGVTVRRESLLSPDFGDGGWDGIVIGLQLAWLDVETAAAVFANALHALRPGGRLLLCTFGPDTLQQVRAAWQAADELPHVHAFTDMHLIGDQLLQCGFQNPILDVDRVTVEYPAAAVLHADLRAEGFTNIAHARRKTLTGKTRFGEYEKALASLRDADGMLSITYELIYAVATAPSPSSGVRVPPPSFRQEAGIQTHG